MPAAATTTAVYCVHNGGFSSLLSKCIGVYPGLWEDINSYQIG